MTLVHGLEWFIRIGAGIVASYLFEKFLEPIPAIGNLENNLKFALVAAVTSLLAIAAWGILLFSPGAVPPATTWAWLEALFITSFTAISASQFTYYWRSQWT